MCAGMALDTVMGTDLLTDSCLVIWVLRLVLGYHFLIPLLDTVHIFVFAL